MLTNSVEISIYCKAIVAPAVTFLFLTEAICSLEEDMQYILQQEPKTEQ